MVTPGTTDVTYMGRPKWSVAHHLSVAGVPWLSKTVVLQRLNKQHRRYIIAASVAIGFMLAAIYFGFIKLQYAARTVHDSTKPWAASAVEAKEKEPVMNNQTSTVPSAAISTSTPEQQTNTTTVTINGEQVPIPDNGTVHRTYVTGNSQSTIDIKVHQSSGP